MNQGHPRDAAATPEQRWRRTVDRRDKAKLKVGRLLRDFGFEELTADAVEQIETRLASVGVAVVPRLINADAKGAVTLEIKDDAAPLAPPVQTPFDIPTEVHAQEPPAGAPAAEQAEQSGEDAAPDAPHPDQEELLPAEAPEPEAPEPAIAHVPAPNAGGGDDPLSRARAESARLLEERSQVERRLEASGRELKAAEQDIANLKDTVAATRLEVQRAAQELQLALAGESAPASNEKPKQS